jgi:hypothetical protein
MFDPSRLEEVERLITEELSHIEVYDSLKLYLCWYDEYLVPRNEFNGRYPCSDKKVDLGEVLQIIQKVMKKPYIVRHNSFITIPVGLTYKKEDQLEIEKYVEVCLVKNACLHC